MIRVLLLPLIFLFVSCAKSPEAKIAQAIDMALTYLSYGKCDDALEVLLEIEGEETNGTYLQVLASAYTCKAGFNEISFIANDLANMNTTSVSSLLTSFATLQLSVETEVDSVNYRYILTAINTLLNSTEGAPSQTARTTDFGLRKGGDLGVQALILNIVNFGKFLHYYGNVDAQGVKGGGTGTNTCFIDYNDPRAQAVVGVSTGACNSNSDGHVDLNLSTVDGRRRLCEGLVLLTNIIDVLENVDLSGNSLSKLAEVGNLVTNFKTSAEAVGLSVPINMTSQSECIDYIDTPGNLLDLEFLYSLIYESGLQ